MFTHLHIYSIIEYKFIFTDHVRKMAKVYERFRQNYQKREKYHIEIADKKKQCEESLIVIHYSLCCRLVMEIK